LEGTQSIDAIKKLRINSPLTLLEYFESTYGPPYSLSFQSAAQNFARSLAGYSLFTFIAQVKDRHNANILVDEQGHLVHIDFGFILGGKLMSLACRATVDN
jgi:phosphatidylinositol kinase/protein kinase (PI-3  family)